MTIITAILIAGLMISLSMFLGMSHTYDYHTDLKNISYQLSRIADALNKKRGEQDGQT